MSFSKVDRQTGDLKTIAGTPSDAIQVAYNNATSGLTAGNVQSAIDEVSVQGYRNYQIYQAAGSGWKKISGFKTEIAYDSAGFRLQWRNGGLAEINLSSQDMNRQDIKVWAFNPTAKLEAITFDADNGELYIRVGQYTRLDITQFSGKRLSLTVTSVSESAGDAVVIESVPLSQLPNFEFMNKVRQNKFAQKGIAYGHRLGFLRQGRIPKKVVVIGNSITMHGPRSDVGWNVDDYREMAASTPTSGWVSIIYRELKTLNPNVEVYKTNGASWESASVGTRSYSTSLAGLTMYKMTDTGCEATSLTLANVLNSKTDMVVIQLYENCPNPAGATERRGFYNDYANLYKDIKTAAPNAFLYQHAGFWCTIEKHLPLYAACMANQVEFCFNPRFNSRDAGFSTFATAAQLFEHSMGDNIYDGDGNVLCTITNSGVASHPNDNGFMAMAGTVLYRMFNRIPCTDSQDLYPLFGQPSLSGINSVYEVIKNEIFYDGTREDGVVYRPLFNNYANYMFDFLVMAANYEVAMCFIDTVMHHGSLVVNVEGPGSMYTRAEQVLNDINSPSAKLRRDVVLASDWTTFGPWRAMNNIVISSAACYALDEWFQGKQVYRWVYCFSKDYTTPTTDWQNLREMSVGDKGRNAVAFEGATQVVRTFAYRPADSSENVIADRNTTQQNGVSVRLRTSNAYSTVQVASNGAQTADVIKAGTTVVIDFIK